METSALFSVGRKLNMRVAAVLMVSDCHPTSINAPKWKWKMTGEMRAELADSVLKIMNI